MNIEYYDNLLFKSCNPTKAYLEMLRTTNSNTHIYPAIITETPYVLTEIGLPSGTISISKRVVNKAMGLNHQGNLQGHNVTMPFMKNITKHIADPLLVMKSSTVANERHKNDSFVIFSDFKINEKPVVIPFVIEPDLQTLGKYRITSIYDRQVIYDGINVIKESVDKGLVLYSRDIDTLDEWIKKEVRPPLTVRADIISAPASGANLDTLNIKTKEQLVNCYIKNQKETVFIYGGELKNEDSALEYRFADKLLKQRGYHTFNPHGSSEQLDIANLRDTVTYVAYFESKDNGKMSRTISPKQLAEKIGVPCSPIKDMLPEPIINKRNLEIAHKDPATLMMGGLSL